ncbi:ribosomal protein L5 [Calocera viscosa TUFC12733]|uniref:Ribosomal protein L5 n=1 Tax=Calocera viscosa (strain TUFC12733) TaxID=1330018 RepID=A0A167II53_CALVF|nr:ribosomal protein L5 [Calocera viscosa TUFC12733]
MLSGGMYQRRGGGEGEEGRRMEVDRPGRAESREGVGEAMAARCCRAGAEERGPDLLYLLYDVASPTDLPDPGAYVPLPDPSNPYTSNRPTSRLKGGHHIRPNAKPISPSTLPKLEKIVLHSFIKEASGKRDAIVPVIAAFRAISGSTQLGGGVPGAGGVQIAYSKQSVQRWKLRPRQPMAVKVSMRGEQMWTFLNSLVEFVIPRLRDFPGFVLPSSSSSPNTPNNMSGTVSIGFPPTAMGLFPQVEVNFDAYPRMHGFHVQFVTDLKGKDAQDRARQMLSGFRIPFIRR